jgi:hypothetical protein
MRRRGHVLHAARDDAGRVAGLDSLRREHHRLKPGAADLVDRLRAERLRQPSAKAGLARRVLPKASLKNAPHDALVDPVLDRRSLIEDRLDRVGPEFRRRRARQPAEELPDRRALGGDDDGLTIGGQVGHLGSPRRIWKAG